MTRAWFAGRTRRVFAGVIAALLLPGCELMQPAAGEPSTEAVKVQARRAAGRENGRYQAVGRREYQDAYAIFILDSQTGRTCAVVFTFDEKKPDALRCAPSPPELDLVGSN